MATDWSAIENVLRTWVATASGLVTIWDAQNGPRPTAPFCSMMITGLTPIGAVDDLIQTQDLGAPNGEEITLTVRGLRQGALRINCYTPAGAGDSAAYARLSRVQAALRLPTVRSGFHAAGMSPFDAGRVLHVPQVLDSDHEGRATLEIGFYATESVAELVGYIASVELTGDPGGVFTAP